MTIITIPQTFDLSQPSSPGYQGSQAAMYSIRDADVIIALGTRLSPFGTLPQYGEEYWPANAKVIQVFAWRPPSITRPCRMHHKYYKYNTPESIAYTSGANIC